jgi:uncharacterized membrane protein YidH (DUF202 family)
VSDANDALVEDEELPGLAGERTDLAWTRIGLSVIAVIAAVLKRVVRGLDLESASAVVFALLIAGAVAYAAVEVYTQAFRETARPDANVTDPERLRRVATATTIFAVAAAALALFP